MKKPEWFKLTDNDTHISTKPKNPLLLIGVIGIGVILVLFFVPQKVANAPVIQTPKIHAPSPIDSINKPSIPTLDNEEDDFEDD